MADTVWMVRGDGQRFEVEVGSASYDRLKDAGATIDGEPAAVGPDQNAVKGYDFESMTKKQLFELAVEKDVPVTEKMTKAQIVEAIEAKQAEK